MCGMCGMCVCAHVRVSVSVCVCIHTHVRAYKCVMCVYMKQSADKVIGFNCLENSYVSKKHVIL